MDSARYLEQLKKQYRLGSDYALAAYLGITQPETNLIRRGRKIPNPELCIRIAKALGRNPIELLLVAQKDKAPKSVKPYWNIALTAVDVMLQVPKRPRYFPQKIEAMGQELRQMSNQMLTYEGALAHAEAVRLMEATQRSVDSVMERWYLWRKGEPFYPHYLIVNQRAVKRNVVVRRLLILRKQDLKNKAARAESLRVMLDQKQSGILVYFALREELGQSVTFRQLQDSFHIYGGTTEINTALFDEELLLFTRAYQQVSLGDRKSTHTCTHVDQLEITWKPEHLQALSPLPLFDMTRYVVPFRGERAFHRQIDRWTRVNKMSHGLRVPVKKGR